MDKCQLLGIGTRPMVTQGETGRGVQGTLYCLCNFSINLKLFYN